MSIKKQEICKILYDNTQSAGPAKCITLIEQTFDKKLSPHGREILTRKLTNLKLLISSKKNKLSISNKSFSRVMTSLKVKDREFELDDNLFEIPQAEAMDIDQPSTSNSHRPVGRPRKTKVEEMKGGTKLRFIAKTAEELKNLQNVFDIGIEIAKKEEKLETRKFIKKLKKLEAENKLEEYSTKANQPPQQLPKVSIENALQLISQNNLSVRAYKRIAKVSKDHGADIYPSYKKILNFKQRQMPQTVSAANSDD